MLKPILQKPNPPTTPTKANPSTTPTAEYVIGLLLSLSYQLPEAHQSILNGQWQPETFTGGTISGQTLGIIGFGEVGSQVANVAQAFGMKVLVYSPSLSDEEAKILGDRAVNLDSLLTQSDYITLHLPLTPERVNFINAEAFAKMKNTARLINCTDKKLVDEAALIAALETGEIAGAALDVYDTESLRNSPLRNLGNKVILTPQIANHVQQFVNIGKLFQDVLELGKKTLDAGRQTVESFLQEIESTLNPPQYAQAFSPNLRHRFASTTRSRSADAESPKAKIRVVKLVDFGNQESPLALINDVELEADEKRDILLQIYPTGESTYLPPDLQLIVLDDSGEIFLEAKSRTADNWIQLEFRGEAGETFTVKTVLGDDSFTEDYVI
ncbi:DUF1822 family protein [Kamptonema sp. UHCC 0994]|uniref:DUF1822 family protein n=1 Tax=Kamptonema sp. UHCC 0994 TaxID=3031329 RepID=UPI0023B9E47F|nr:DUF1822 family protein [Kamptonema sp. UHCC 0994]MDF0555601.1 DUF1822 family protein [Kamptonema sp. UHCC 0994]